MLLRRVRAFAGTPHLDQRPRHRECPHGLLVAVFFARTSARTSTAGGATGILVLPDPNSIPLGDGYFCVMVITAGAPGVAHDRTIHNGPALGAAANGSRQ
jgi:hypothetical protein